jgi:lysophospholipase L1-like esterase
MIDFEGKANSLGFRDREHAVAKPAGVYRILVLGDSIVQGLSVANREDLFTSVLERELDADAPGRFEVLNFGVSGYNTQQEVETLRDKGLRYSPDLVVLAYCLNDTYLDSGPYHSPPSRRRAPRPGSRCDRRRC